MNYSSLKSGEVGSLSCKVKFTLSNNSTFTLNSSETINLKNYLSAIKLTEQISAENNIPVGVNSSNVLDLEIISENHALIPENESSIYYGYMDDTAIVELFVTIVDEDKEVYFGKYFVDTWKSVITSDEPNKVKISATCIMGVITKQVVPDVLISNGLFIKDYVIAVIEELNNTLPANKHINYREDDIDFSIFPTMQFSNLDTEDMSNCLNGLSQCTLTNIYADRDGYIKTDFTCDDTSEEAKYRLDVMTAAQAGSGVLVNYDGVKVKYSLGNILDVEQLASLYQQNVVAGDNTFKEINLGEAVYKINKIEVTAEDNSIDVDIKSAKYNKNKMTLVIEAEAATKVNISIYGQRLDTTELIYEIQGKNELEINNKVLESQYINKYADYMVQLIGFKNNSMQVSGYFRPDIKLADIIFINCIGAMSVSGFYKVIGLEWEFGVYGKCTIDLIKTFESEFNIDDIMFNFNDLLELTLAGVYTQDNKYTPLSQKENDYVNQVLGTEFDELRMLEYGEV